MSFEVWLLFQVLAIVKVAATGGLAALACVPAVRLMRKRK